MWQGAPTAREAYNMTRRLLILAALLLAGAVVNVAVAWGCGWAHIRATTPMNYRPVDVPADDQTRAWWCETRPDGVTDELGGLSGWSLQTAAVVLHILSG